MGCLGSSASGPSGPISLEGVDINKNGQKSVPDFDFYSGRLAEIDYESIIAKGERWEDPNFDLTNGILDKTQSH
jgi:hypothetical protein